MFSAMTASSCLLLLLEISLYMRTGLAIASVSVAATATPLPTAPLAEKSEPNRPKLLLNTAVVVTPGALKPAPSIRSNRFRSPAAY